MYSAREQVQRYFKKKRQKKKPLRNDGRYFDRRWKSKESCEVIENLAICRG
jgi:hypothetical protein